MALNVHVVQTFWPSFCPFGFPFSSKPSKRAPPAAGRQPYLKEFCCCGTAALCCELYHGNIVFYMSGRHLGGYIEPPSFPFQLTLRGSVAPRIGTTSQGPPTLQNLPAPENLTQEESHDGLSASSGVQDDTDDRGGTTTTSAQATAVPQAMDGSEPSASIAEERSMQEDGLAGSNGKMRIAARWPLQIHEEDEDNTIGDNCGSSGMGAASTGTALGIFDKFFTDNEIQGWGTAAAAVAITTPPLGHNDKNDSAQDLTGALEEAAMHHTRDLGHVLGVAISDKAPLSVIRAIVEADSLSLLCRRGPNGRGCNQLYRAFGEKEPLLHVLNFLVDEGKAERVPLHLAADDAPLEVVQLLVNKCPQALMMKDKDNRLPLHVAVAAGSWTCHDKPWKVKPDKTRSLMTSFRSAEVIKCLIEACPGALLVKDDEGNTPLHLAVLFASAEVVRMLVIKCPEALLEKDASGGLPLHVAVSDEATPLGIVRCLVDACPDALHVEKDDGNLPLHVAAEHASLDAIRLLVERRPESLLAKNKNGERPVALARHGTDGVKELFAQWDADAAAAPAQSQLLQHDPTSEIQQVQQQPRQQQLEQMEQDAARPHNEVKNKEEDENVEEQSQKNPVSSSTLDLRGGGIDDGEGERPSRAGAVAAPKIDGGPGPVTARTTGSKQKTDIATIPFRSERGKADEDVEGGSGSTITTHPLGRHDDEALDNNDNEEDEASCSTQDSNEEAEECRAAPAADEEDVAHPDAAPSSRGSVMPDPAPSSQGSVFPDLAPSSQGSVLPEPAPSSLGSVVPDPAPSSQGSVFPDPAPSSQGSAFPDPAPSSSLALGEAAAAALATPLRRRDDDDRAIPVTSLSGGVEDLVPPAREGLPPPTSVDSNKKPRIC